MSEKKARRTHKRGSSPLSPSSPPSASVDAAPMPIPMGPTLSAACVIEGNALMEELMKSFKGL